MEASTRKASRMAYVPALIISLLVLVAAGILGGPIAAAISAVAVLPALATSSAAIFLMLKRYSPPTRAVALALGFGLYVLSAIVVIICLDQFGPSQIM